MGTKVAAKKAYAFGGTPDVNLNWTDPEVDTGSLDVTVAPYQTASDITAALTDNALRYNTIPLIMSAIFGGGETPTGGGTAKTWTHSPASVVPLDDFDFFTYEFGDDVLTDWFQLGDGILESLEITGPEGLGPLTTSMGWRFGSASSTGATDRPVTGSVPTDLDVDPNEAMVYLKDGGIYISDDPYDLEYSQISDALHSFVLRISGDLDQKRFANQSQSFDVQGYGRASRAFELECTFAKTADTVGTGSESDDWMSDDSVDRFVRLYFESTTEAQSGIPNSWEVIMPMRYYTRAEGESGGNTTVILTGHGFYDPDSFGGVFRSTVVNTLATASL